MATIIDLSKIDKSKYTPTKEEDFKCLNRYKPERLFSLIRCNDKHKNQIIDHLFFRLKEEEEIEEFKSTLKDINEYNEFVNQIKNSKNDKYKQHLALYYENSLIDELYNGEYNLAKQIYKKRKKLSSNNYCCEHLLKLASIADEYTTLLIIKEELVKLVKESIRATYIYNLYQFIFEGRMFTEENRLNIKHYEKFMIDDFINEAEKSYLINQRNKNNL